MKRLRVQSSRNTYPVVVGRGAWRELGKLRNHYSSTFILTEKAIWKHWGPAFREDSALGVPEARILVVPGGEMSKSMMEAERLAGLLLKLGADRRSLLVLFGGGVV